MDTFPQPLNWRSCEFISSQREQVELDRIVCEFQHKMGRGLNILEIGSYRGQSTVLLAQYGHVIAIDLWGDVDHGVMHPESYGKVNLQHFVVNVSQFGLLGTRIFPIVGTSEILDRLHPESLDLVYIDADHSYEPCKADLTRAITYLSPDGMLLCHDYKRPGDAAHIGVNRAVDELLAQGEYGIKEHFGGLVCLQRGIGA